MSEAEAKREQPTAEATPPTPPTTTEQSPPARRKRRWARRVLWGLLIYLLIAYVILPAAWTHYEHQPNLAAEPKTTFTKNHIPGDPLNVGLVGEQDELVKALTDAGWHPADAITARSSVHIAESVVLDRKYEDAPVSSLFVFGRKQDLAFEQLVGDSAKERHHVRFWKSEQPAEDGRPTWLGAATFDRSVGLSHRTGQITHHIDADVDKERDHVMNSLIDAKQLSGLFQVTGVGPTINGHNGGGDRYFTDGELTVGVVSPHNAPSEIPPVPAENPPAVVAKNRAWRLLRGWFE